MSSVTSRGCSSAAAKALSSVCCRAPCVAVCPPKRSCELPAGPTLCLLQLSPNYSPPKIGLAIFSSFPLDLPGYLEISDCCARVSVTSGRIQQCGSMGPHLVSVEVKGAGIVG